MADVLLVQPLVGILDEIKSAPALPLSLLTAAKLVCQECDVKIVDQRIERENWKKVLKKELKKNPICVGTTTMLGPQIKFGLEISEFIKKESDVPIVWGGPQASVLPIQTIENKNIDIIIQGDGEITFLELVKALKNKKPLKNVRGILYKSKGKIIQTESRPLLDINEMPDVPYHLVDVKKYLPKRMGVPTIDIETSRGCPNRCAFCYNPFYNKGRWRFLRTEVALERIEKVINKFGAKGIWFIDDEFFVDLGRARKIIERLKELNIIWTVQGTRIRSALGMDDDYIKMLEDSGCRQLNFGVETGSEKILKKIHKGITIPDVLRVNKKFSRYNIVPWYYFMIGFPYETEKEVKKTIDLTLRLLSENPKAKISSIACFTPYPGTQLFEESKKYGYTPPGKLSDWSLYATDNINVPWLSGKKKREVEVIQFISLFMDQKAKDVVDSKFINFLANLYRPVALFRLRHQFYSFPLDVYIGKLVKERKISL
ncbi:MAG: radical SAM protein [Candidatus Aenigmarchaeota archaeon]|nr:radical SAM protein [Candidatus Aenigmarchaeota archaeon]